MGARRGVLQRQQQLLLLLLLLLGACSLAASGAQARRTQRLYHRQSEVLHWFSTAAARQPAQLQFQHIREAGSNVTLPLASFAAGDGSKPVLLFVFGEHAREVITSEVGLWLGRMLLSPDSAVFTWPELGDALMRAGALPQGSGSSSWAPVARRWVAEALARLEVGIVPIASLDSRQQVEAGQLCVRKTASNVDLNRNWPFAWVQQAPSDEQYGGREPFSEPQSRLMRQVATERFGSRLLGYVNVHSGESALYTPWDSQPAYGPGLPADLPGLVSTIGRLCNCKAGPAGAVSGYLAYGTSMDWLYVHQRVPYPLTVEVYGGDEAGRLAAGDVNKLLADWPVRDRTGVEAAADAASPRRRRVQLLQQQQQQQQGGAAGTGGPLGWLHALHARRRLAQEQPQLPAAAPGKRWAWPLQQQHQQRHGRRRRHHSRGGGPANGGGSRAARLGLGPAGAAEMEAAADAAAAGGFAHGQRLEALRAQAQQQQAQQQQQQQQAGAQGGGDASERGDFFLRLVAAAAPAERSCWGAFNPSREAEYRRTVGDWLAGFLLMLRHMAASEARERLAANATRGLLL